MPVNDPQEPLKSLLVIDCPVKESLRIPLYARQRRPQLMRYVGDEVLLYRLDPFLLGYVLKEEKQAELPTVIERDYVHLEKTPAL